jgi:hypothetical protein
MQVPGSFDIAGDHHFADIGFVDDDPEPTGCEVLRRDQGEGEVVMIPVDTLDAVKQSLDIGKRDGSAEQIPPQREEQRWVQRHHALEFNVAEDEADIG